MRIAERIRALAPSLGLGAAIGAGQLCWSWSLLQRDISTDESFTFYATNGGPGGLVAANIMDPAMSAYYVVGWALSLVFSDSLLALRLLTLACWAAIAVIVCEVARRRGRWWAGPLAMVALGVTPIAREATVDARASVPASLVAVVVMLFADRMIRSDGKDRVRRVRGVAIGVAALAFTHPSGFGAAGVGWLALAWVAWRAGVEAKAWAAAAGAAVAVAFAANMMQAGHIDGLVEPGFAGFRFTLGLLWGGNALIAAVVIVGTAAILALDARRDPLAGLSGVTSVAWTAALAAAVPFVTMFIARYLMVSCVLLALASVAVPAVAWRRWALGGFAAVGIVGGVISHDRLPGEPSRWCDVAETLEASAGEGDLVVYPSGAAITAIGACLDRDDADALVARTASEPDLSGLDRTNPRTMWRLETHPLAVADRVESNPPSGHLHIVLTPDPAPATLELIDRLGAMGWDCVGDAGDEWDVVLCSAS